MKIVSTATLLLVLSAISIAQNRAAASVAVPLNHFYLSLDHETYAAIDKNSFLQTEFAVFERRTTVRADMTYTGIYFYGTHTYFEFFDSSKQTDMKQGSSGLAFGVEQPGALQSLPARLTATTPDLITRQNNGRQVSWFYMLGLEPLSSNSVLISWVMEYHPEFLSEWHPQAGGANRGILREQILRRYKGVLANAPQHPLLEDVVELTIAVDAASIVKLKEVCERFGYHARAEGAATVLQGPEIVLRLIPETSWARGIKQIGLRVRKMPKGQTEFRFGPRSVLRFLKNGKAVWNF